MLLKKAVNILAVDEDEDNVITLLAMINKSRRKDLEVGKILNDLFDNLRYSYKLSTILLLLLKYYYSKVNLIQLLLKG